MSKARVIQEVAVIRELETGGRIDVVE